VRRILVLVFAVACGGPPTPKDVSDAEVTSDTGADHLEAEFGGPAGLMAFFDSTPDSTIATTLNAHAIAFARNDATLTECETTFPEGDRATWHAFDGEFYFIEAHGRPNRAYKYLPPIVEADRIEACQGNVGRWGDSEDESNDYDGGHMVGSQLGGYGGRVNLVPQDANFNRGNWVQIENTAAKCGALPDERIFYYVRAEYDDETSLVPKTMSLTLENRDTEESVSFTFKNVDGGGPEGTEQRTQAVEFLKAQGCT
jgi:hypothetical protein